MSTGPRRERENPELANAVFWGWEKWRVGYNLGLALGVIGYWTAYWGLDGGPIMPFTPAFLYDLVIQAVFANVCFCAGPVAEGYLCWLGFPREGTRLWLVGLGVFLAMMLAIYHMETWIPPQEVLEGF
jgi:hypothetical protein